MASITVFPSRYYAQKNLFEILLDKPEIRLYCIYHSRLIWIQTDFRLYPNQSENGKYNLISGLFKKISKIFSVYTYFCELMFYINNNSSEITQHYCAPIILMYVL